MNRIYLTLAVSIIIGFGNMSAQTTLLWSESAGTSASSQKSYVATDLIGNIYMASSVNGTYGLDWKVTSWRPDSVARWTYTYNGGGNQDDIPAAIVVDSAFSVFVAGTIKSSGSNDIRVIKLDSAGNLKWGTNYNRTGTAQDVATSLAISGNKLWVCGYSQQSTSNYDYTLLKYDTAGTLSWSRHVNGSGSGDDYCNALAVKSNGDAFITGNAVITGGTRDMLTLRYLNDGTLSWTKYYGNTTGQNDYGNAIGINGSGDIIVGGQSYVTASNSNLSAIKYSASSGAQTWATSYAGSYGGHDAGASLVIDPDNYFYITGYTQTGSSNYDYVTIKYRGNGQLTWAQTYNGPGNGIDEACAIIHDGDDVVITGKSTGSGTGLDVCTISMVKSSGSVNWTMRVNEAGSSGDWGLSLCKDEMGNVIVAGSSLISSSYGNSCYKFNQATKNAAAIELNLKMLGYGAAAIVSDTMSKRILYDMAALLVDSVYQVHWKRYLAKCDLHSSHPRTIIRQGIVTQYSLSSGINWENVLDRRIYDGFHRRAPMIFIPAFQTFTRNAFINNAVETAYSHMETDFPILSLPDGNSLYEADFATTPTLTLIAHQAVWWNKNTPGLVYCYAEKINQNGNTCSHCGVFDPVDGLSPGSACVGNALNFEVGIHIGYDYNGSCVPTGDIEKCLTVYDYATGAGLASPYFAIVHQMPGIPCYRLYGTGDYQKVKKVPYGIYDDNTQSYGVALSLCQEWNTFNSLNPAAPTQDFAIAHGGIFQVVRPGTGQRPVYFTLPYAQNLRYYGYPDMQLCYGTQFPQTTCTDGRDEIQEDYFAEGSPILNASQTVFGWTFNQTTDVFMTTDFQTINSYWSDNAITVAFNTTTALVTPGNFTTFYASTSTATCDPLSYNLASSTPVCTLQVLNDQTYEVRQNFFGTPTPTFAAGTNFLVHVRAKYSNGESIDECQQLTLVTGSTGIKNVVVEIRGGINDYSATVTNYKVDVYLMN